MDLLVVIKEFAEDGVKYLELRTTPRLVPGRMSKYEYCCSVLEEIVQAAEVRGVTVKLLLAVDRKNFNTFDETIRWVDLILYEFTYDFSIAACSDISRVRPSIATFWWVLISPEILDSPTSVRFWTR